MYKKILLGVVVTLSLGFTLNAVFAESTNSAAANSPVTSPVKSPVPATITTPTGITKFDADFLKQSIGINMRVEVSDVFETPMPNIALIKTNLGMVYSTYDGQFIIYRGDVYSVADNFTKLTDLVFASSRIDSIKKFEDEMIVYKAKDEKYVVTVFTDVNCGYCRKMHAEMEEYNARGITVRYLASLGMSGYKDNGNFTPGYKAMRSAWCSDDQTTALTQIKSGKAIPEKNCDILIEAQAKLGTDLGVTGTPAIIFPNGVIGPGYLDPQKLEAMLIQSSVN